MLGRGTSGDASESAKQHQGNKGGTKKRFHGDLSCFFFEIFLGKTWAPWWCLSGVLKRGLEYTVHP
jgi:hypothetical protein